MGSHFDPQKHFTILNNHEEIDEYVTKCSELRSRQPAGEHEISNVKIWLQWRFSDAIFPAESKYITKLDDLIRVVPGMRSPLVKKMEKHSSIAHSIFSKKQVVSVFRPWSQACTWFYVPKSNSLGDKVSGLISKGRRINWT